MNPTVIILILAYAMPGRVPDIATKIEEPSLDACWVEAREFVDRGVPNSMKEKGAVGVYAGCRAPSEYSVDQ